MEASRKQREAGAAAAEITTKRPVGRPRSTPGPAVTAAADAAVGVRRGGQHVSARQQRHKHQK